MPPATARTYGGVGGEQRVADRRTRLLAAGLDLLGTPDAVLSVRGVCKTSGLIARYFYESFDDIDALAVAVHDAVIADLVHDAVTRMESAPETAHARLRHGLTAIVAHLAEDPRRGHVLFVAAMTVPALVARRPEVVAMFAEVVRAHTDPRPDRPEHRMDTAARFVVAGFGEVLTGWQAGTLDVTQEQLVDACVDLFSAAARV